MHWMILAFRSQKIFQQFSTIWQNKHHNILCYFNQCMLIIFVQNRPKPEFLIVLFLHQLFPITSPVVQNKNVSWVIFLVIFQEDCVIYTPLFIFPCCASFKYAFLTKVLHLMSYYWFLQYSNAFCPQMLARNLPKELINQSKRCLRFGLHCYAENLLYPGKVKNFWNLSKHDFECPESYKNQSQ